MKKIKWILILVFTTMLLLAMGETSVLFMTDIVCQTAHFTVSETNETTIDDAIETARQTNVVIYALSSLVKSELETVCQIYCLPEDMETVRNTVGCKEATTKCVLLGKQYWEFFGV